MKEYYWHIHHDQLMEFLTESVANRISFIKQRKPKPERALRLRLLKPVTGKLPVALIRAGEACDKAKEAYNKAGKAHDKVRMDYGETWGFYTGNYVPTTKAQALAGKAYDKIRDARKKWLVAYNKTKTDYGKTRETHKNAIEKLHRAECPKCPWDGKTIFSELKCV